MIERVPLDTLPQAVVMSLAHNHLTNLFILSYRGATIKQQKQLCGRRQCSTSLLVAATTLPFDHVTLINLYISSYREATGVTFIHKHLGIIDLLLQIFCNNKILQERQMQS